MSATQSQTKPEATAFDRGFPGLPCPRCGETDCVRVYLEDLSCDCRECKAEWTLEEIDSLVATWALALRWLLSAPHVES